tara:strand:- start:1315 stop:2241 length:927 start_codon:yes stop_codon:yes gene_type:complete
MFDHSQKVGGWFRIGNRVNEGLAEMSCCIYLPDGQVGFMFKRPKIETNSIFNAGGMAFVVEEPFERLSVKYEGKLCLLKNPKDMKNPKKAFSDNPLVNCKIDLTYEGISPMFGGRPLKNTDQNFDLKNDEQSFSKAHYEQHVSAKGIIEVGEKSFEVRGLGLRDKSWGPRYWQAISWYRWLPMAFSEEFAMMVSLICKDGKSVVGGGMVLHDDSYHLINEVEIDSEWDTDWHQKSLIARVSTNTDSYEIKGEVKSLIPLRNQRVAPDGNQLLTRITEGLTKYTCNGHIGWGMSEYLDQIVDGVPTGAK